MTWKNLSATKFGSHTIKMDVFLLSSRMITDSDYLEAFLPLVDFSQLEVTSVSLFLLMHIMMTANSKCFSKHCLTLQLAKRWTLEISQEIVDSVLTNHSKDQDVQTSHKTTILLTLLLALWFSHTWLAYFLQRSKISETILVFTVFPASVTFSYGCLLSCR